MYAEIIGWGKCAPPAILTNDDLATFLDTSDDWIYTRTGIKRRHISHVPCSEMARVGSERAIACAGIKPTELDLVILGTTTPDQFIPNSASTVVNAIGASNAAGFDVNSACTSFLYSLNIATDMIKAGSIKTALVIGVEKTTRLLDWGKRESAVLFGDGGGALVLRATEQPLGMLGATLSLIPNTREMLSMPGFGVDLTHQQQHEFYPSLNFEGQEIFKNAVKGMHEACKAVLEKTGFKQQDMDFFVPHQANVRIIKTLAKRMNFDMTNVMVCVNEYGNCSAGTIPLSLCDALEAGRIKSGMTLLTASFGAGLTCGAAIIKWGNRTSPIALSDAKLPPCHQTAIEILQPAIEAAKQKYSE